MVEIYRRLRPGETPSVDTARALFDNLFLNSKRYDLSPVGRLKLNKKLALDLPLEQRTLTAQDMVEVIRYLVNLKLGKGEIDDIDHLGNRRVRSVGELLENQFRLGLVRMERSIKERMNLLDMETVLPHDLDQCEARRRRCEGILQQQSVVSVHGPDESSRRNYPQAAACPRSVPAV